MKPRHLVTNVDAAAQLGDCAICGQLVKLKRMTPGEAGRWRCRFAYRENNRINRRLRTKRKEGRGKYITAKGCTCARCAFVAEHPCQMDVHHVNRDHSDNRPENLETLFANCHRLEHSIDSHSYEPR